MANLHGKRVFGNQVFYDTYRQRWVDAIGGGVTKFILDTAYAPADDTTGDLSGFTHTAVEVGAGTSTAVLADNALLITTAGNEDDGVNLQVKGEAFKLDAATKQVYFGVNITLSEVTQCDAIIGLVITDTDSIGGVSDGVYFITADGSATLSLALEKNGTATTTSLATIVDATNYTLEFMFDGTNVDSWIDGVLQTRGVATNLPNDEFLTPSITVQNGSAAAKTATINWLRVIQLDGTK